MPSTMRDRTEHAARSGFMESIMRRRDFSDFDEVVNQREKKATQEEQDAEDEELRKRAMRDLISSWQERLQLISVITTFFATTEAAMLVNTRPANMDDLVNVSLKLSNSGLLGSLVLHVYASVLSFLGAFLLTSYKLREAARVEKIIEGIPMANSPLREPTIKDVERDGAFTSNDAQFMINCNTVTSIPKQITHVLPSTEPQSPVFSTNPHIETVGPLLSHASSHRLLSRIHAVCVLLTAAGFILAILGIVAYAWALHPRGVSIFTSVCLGGALLAMPIALVV